MTQMLFMRSQIEKVKDRMTKFVDLILNRVIEKVVLLVLNEKVSTTNLWQLKL